MGRTQGMGRTVGQLWYGGTEGSPWDSPLSPPGLRGWKGLGKIVWDCLLSWDSLQSPGLSTVTFLGLPSVPRTVYCYFPGTSFSPQDCLLLLSWDSLQSSGLSTVNFLGLPSVPRTDYCYFHGTPFSPQD